MKKKALKLNRLTLKKDMIGSLVQSKIKGGISDHASCVCTVIPEQATCGIPCSRVTCARVPTECLPCQSGACPTLGC